MNYMSVVSASGTTFLFPKGLMPAANEPGLRLTSCPCVTHQPANPILSAKDVPYEATAGVTKYQGRYVMAFRNDYFPTRQPGRWERISIGLAFSDGGVKWDAQPKPVSEMRDHEVNCA